ncbi:MAG: hypothetical protein BGO76_07755 [Caedibacter sp. 38-128]|nr:hypothetical protein [Holosporales bacterium]OJX04895.1 MAG: hypothetical protein BGO76_07755 [Caedibacter sp. 38-128]
MRLILSFICYSFIISPSFSKSKFELGYRSTKSIPTLENIPLMRGLKRTGEIEDVGQGGDIYRIETEASGNLFVEDIEEFYQDALQANEWERIGRFAYVLNDKYLEIIPQNKGGMLTVIFQLKTKVF